MKLLKKIDAFIKRDTTGENESITRLYVIRLLVLAMMAYTIVTFALTIILNGTRGMAFFICCVVINVLLFAGTYKFKTGIMIAIYNITTITWIVVNLLLFGWNVGVQHFIMVLLVLVFFSAYEKITAKVIYSIALCGFRIVLFFIFQGTKGSLHMGITHETFFQIINTMFTFWCIATPCYIYSKKSLDSEGKLKAYNVKLISESRTDALTGLNNRRTAIEHIDENMSVEGTNGVCVCMCDIDFFKKVNDSYGHDIGDEVLKSIADTMKKSLPLDKCFISRWGGEEFLLVFDDCNGDEAFNYLIELQNEIKKLNFTVRDEVFSITLTYGLVECSYNLTAEENIKVADDKLYAGKNTGRDKIVY